MTIVSLFDNLMKEGYVTTEWDDASCVRGSWDHPSSPLSNTLYHEHMMEVL